MDNVFEKKNLEAITLIEKSPISVKSVKTFLGREGDGFNANIYWNNKKIGFATDHADGGELDLDFKVDGKWSFDFEPLHELRDSLPKKSWYYSEYSKEGVDWDISGIINHLVFDVLDRKELKKLMKKVTIYDPKERKIATWNIKSTDMDVKYNFKEEKGINISDFITKYHPNFIILNNLDLDKAMKYWYKAHPNMVL